MLVPLDAESNSIHEAMAQPPNLPLLVFRCCCKIYFPGRNKTRKKGTNHRLKGLHLGLFAACFWSWFNNWNPTLCSLERVPAFVFSVAFRQTSFGERKSVACRSQLVFDTLKWQSSFGVPRLQLFQTLVVGTQVVNIIGVYLMYVYFTQCNTTYQMNNFPLGVSKKMLHIA